MKRFGATFLCFLWLAGCVGSGDSSDTSVSDSRTDLAVADLQEQRGVPDLLPQDADTTPQDLARPNDTIDATPPTDLIELADAADAFDTSDVADVQDTTVPPWEWSMLQPAGTAVKDFVGVSSHMYQGAGDDANRNFELAFYDSLGGAKLREDFHWSSIEPQNDEFHFEAVETQIAMAKENHVEVTILVVYEVAWAMSDPAVTSTIDAQAYADYAGALAQRFCDDVKTYEIWNEEDLKNFWHPGADPVAYGAMLIGAYTAIHAACPDARVLFGGMSSFAVLFNPWIFLRDVADTYPDICNYFDILALHPYTPAQKPPPEFDAVYTESMMLGNQAQLVQIARDILTDIGCADRPIWFTEAGWPSYELTEEQQGLYLSRSMLMALADQVERYYWYTFWDGEPITTGLRPHENYFGLFGWPQGDPPMREKPAAKAFRAIVQMLGEYRFAGNLSPHLGLPEGAFVLAFQNGGGELMLVGWDGRDEPDQLAGGVNEEGGPETHFLTSFPVPEGTVALESFNHLGEATGTIAVPTNGVLSLDLKPLPLFLKVSVE